MQRGPAEKKFKAKTGLEHMTCEIVLHTALPPQLSTFSINLLVVYRESVNLIGYITRRLSADSLQL